MSALLYTDNSGLAVGYRIPESSKKCTHGIYKQYIFILDLINLLLVLWCERGLVHLPAITATLLVPDISARQWDL